MKEESFTSARHNMDHYGNEYFKVDRKAEGHKVIVVML